MLSPSHVVAAAVLVTDSSGLVLMVANPYRTGLVLPGGMVERGESPAAAAEREVFEEVGLRLRVTRLLVVETKPARSGIPDGVQFVFDADQVDRSVDLTLQAGEISSAQWLAPVDAVARHVERGRERIRAAIAARSSGAVVYLDRHLVGKQPRD